MSYEERIKLCKTCNHKKIAWGEGIHCGLTDRLPDFDGDCPNYDPDPELLRREENKKLKMISAMKGKNMLIRLFGILIGFSIFTIFLSVLTFAQEGSYDINKRLFRTAFELGLYYLIYMGKDWAKNLLIFLLSLGILLIIITTIANVGESPIILLALLVLPVYGYVIYHLIQNKDVRNWMEYRRNN